MASHFLNKCVLRYLEMSLSWYILGYLYLTVQVYKGVWKETTVAVKVCRQQHISVKAMKQFQKEVAILHGCSHESIVQFKGACCWKVMLLSH